MEWNIDILILGGTKGGGLANEEEEGEEEEGKKLAMTLRLKIAKSLCNLEADMTVFGQILKDAKTLALGMKGTYGQERRKKCAKLTPRT